MPKICTVSLSNFSNLTHHVQNRSCDPILLLNEKYQDIHIYVTCSTVIRRICCSFNKALQNSISIMILSIDLKHDSIKHPHKVLNLCFCR
uniref:Uncharacterized protein n=1 Tax=Arundo donax TaxID=35708 RepID=A0A0A9E460_ARUDO